MEVDALYESQWKTYLLHTGISPLADLLRECFGDMDSLVGLCDLARERLRLT